MDLNLDFDQTIAERTIMGTRGRKLIVTLGLPRAEVKIGGWLCPYRIDGLPAEPNYRMYGGGIDAIHAIIAALANLGTYLDGRKAELGLSFYDADHLGFLDERQPPLSTWASQSDDDSDTD